MGKRKHLNFSQNEFQYENDKTDLINLNDGDQSSQKIDTDRTIRNSMIKSELMLRGGKNNKSTKPPFYSGLNRSLNERQVLPSQESSTNIGRQNMQKQEVHFKFSNRPSDLIILADQKTAAPRNPGSPHYLSQKVKNFQRSPKIAQKMNGEDPGKIGFTHREDTEEDVYRNYLNHQSEKKGRKPEQEITNGGKSSLLHTVIQQEEETIDMRNILNVYKDEIQQQSQRGDHEKNNAPTPQQMAGISYKKNISKAEMRNLKQKAKNSQNQIYGVPQDVYFQSPHIQRNQGRSKLKEREMTYESERSSIFNENVSLVEKNNRSNFMNQYAYRIEESKKSPNNDLSFNYERIESARSNNKSNSQYQAKINNGKIQQFLELNLRNQDLKDLSEIQFSKHQFLRTVDLRNNSISFLPEALCELNILWKLRIDNNYIEELPSNFGNLQRLEIFTASNNRIKKIPESFWSVKEKLTMIQINDNLIRNLPGDIGSLTKLKYLNPPINKILKDERGLLMLKDFQKLCKLICEMRSHQVRFVHFLAYFQKLSSIDQFTKINIYPKKRSVIHYIALNGHQHLAKDIMEACPQININQLDSDGTSPLILAFKNKQNQVIDFLMKFPITNLNLGSSKYGYPLHLAIKNHDYKLVQRMLKPKYVVNINARDDEGNNAMHYLMGHFGYDSRACCSIGAVMLKKRIELNALNKSEFSPLHIAVKSFQNKSIKFALEYNQYLTKRSQESEETKNQTSSNPFGKQKNSVQMKVYEKFDFNIKGKNQWTPLHYAVFNNNLIAVELLLHAQSLENIDVFARDSEGKLPQELCPYNSPIYKMLVKRQNLIAKQAINQQSLMSTKEIKHKNINRLQIILRDEEPSTQKKELKHSFMINHHEKSRPSHFGGLATSRTEKNLLSKQLLQSENDAQIERQLRYPKVKQISKIMLRKSPRIQQQITAIPAKQLINNEEDNDGQMDLEELFKKGHIVDEDEQKDGCDYKRFMSHPVNFETEQLDDGDEIYQMSNVEVESVSSDSQSITMSGLQRSSIYNQTYFMNMKNDRSPIINKVQFNQMHSPSQQPIDASYQSAPAQKKFIQIIDEDEEPTVELFNDQAFQKQIIRSNQKRRDDEDEDEADYCDAADEDAEAGILGQIANKINKFENHQDNESSAMTEKDALRNFLHEIKLNKQKKNLQQKQELSGDDQFYQSNANQRVEKKISADLSPFEVFQKNSSKKHFEDDGNVFETCERPSPAIYNFDSNCLEETGLYLDKDQYSKRNIKSRENIFIISDNVGSPKSQQMEPFSRKSNVLNRQQSQGALGRLKDLNKDCKIYDTLMASMKLNVEDILLILKDPQVSLSNKYKTLYSVIYTSDGKTLDEKKMKWLFDQLDDVGQTAILKVDLSYLISVSKNKEFIPSLDQALTKYKQDIKIQRSAMISPEPSSLAVSPEITLKTPMNLRHAQTTTAGVKQNQSNCKNLIIYETTNAFDILMQDAMIQSKQMMEQCNQRINLERERSRERIIKLRNLNSQNKNNNSFTGESSLLVEVNLHHQPNQRQEQLIFQPQSQMNQSSQSIREVPEFVARLNKSPSGSQNFKRALTNNLEKNSQQPKYHQQSTSVGDGSSLQHNKKSSFTPKGISGQVFLAFQKQKQKSRGQTRLEQKSSPQKDYETQIPHYKVNLQPEEIAPDTLQNSSRVPENMREPQIFLIGTQMKQAQSPQPAQQINYKSLNFGVLASSGPQSLNNSMSQNANLSNGNSNMASIIQNTLKDINNQKELGLLKSVHQTPHSSSHRMINNSNVIGQQTNIQASSQPQIGKQQPSILKGRESSNKILAKKPLIKQSATSNSSSVMGNISTQVKNAIISVEGESKRGQSNKMIKNAAQNAKRNKIAITKLSPEKTPVDNSTEKLDDRLRKNMLQTHQPQFNYIKHSRKHLAQQDYQMPSTQRERPLLFGNAIPGKQSKNKQNTSVDNQQQRNFKKSTSTSKLTSETSATYI